MDDLISRQAAIDMCRLPRMRNADCSDFEMEIMMLPPAQPAQHIDADGTLWITVTDIEQVKRVIVDEDKSKFCRQFYMDAQPEPCEDAVSRKAVIDTIDEWKEACAGSGHKETVSDIKLIRKDFIDLPSVTPKQSLDIEKVSKEVLNATSKWLNDKDDKRNVLDVIKDVLQPYKGKE